MGEKEKIRPKQEQSRPGSESKLTQVAASPHNCVKLQLKASLFHLVFNSNCS